MTCKDVKELQALRLEVEGLKADNNHLLSGIKQVSRGIMSTGMRKHFNRLIACTPEKSLAKHNTDVAKKAIEAFAIEVQNTYEHNHAVTGKSSSLDLESVSAWAEIFAENYVNKLEAGE